MQFCLPNKELWAKSAKYYLTVSPSNKRRIQFSVCPVVLRYLGGNFESNHDRLAILWKSSLQREGRRGIEQNRQVLRFFDQLYLQH